MIEFIAATAEPAFLLTLLAVVAVYFMEQRQLLRPVLVGKLGRWQRRWARRFFWVMTGWIIFVTLLVFYVHPYSPLEDEVDGPHRDDYRVNIPTNVDMLEMEYTIYGNYSYVVALLAWGWIIWFWLVMVFRLTGDVRIL